MLSDEMDSAWSARQSRLLHMAADPAHEYTRVLDFWFGTLNASGRADDEHSERWWKKDSVFDQRIREEFGLLHASVSAGDRAAWLETPRGRLATIIVLDQFSRNMFRGTARAFAFDGQALTLARDGITVGADRELLFDERFFFYMPYMHGEELAVQERSVELFRALRDSAEPAHLDRANTFVDYAERHHDIIRRFGRFPHRNALLDRTLTAEEITFLKQPGSSF